MFILDLFKWWGIDIYRLFRDRKKEKKVHLYGIYGYFGLYGKGKTMGMTYVLDSLRKKYGDKIYICTNYFYKGEDFHFNSWKQLLEEYDKPLIVGWDEVQNEFNSRDFKNFPVELLTLLTQNRKGNGIQIHYTAQRFGRVDKIFRELTMYCVQCTTILSRWGRLKYYWYEDYEKLVETIGVESKMRIHPVRRTNFVQSDYLRNSYDSYQMLDSAKKKDYMSRDEVINLLK